MRRFSVEQIARVAHEANRAFCESIADHSQVKWEDAPKWQRNMALKGVEFHVAHHTLYGLQPEPSASHDSWLEAKIADGWTYGAIKDPAQKQHPCIVPYADLPFEQRVKDYLFGAVVAAFAAADSGEK